MQIPEQKDIEWKSHHIAYDIPGLGIRWKGQRRMHHTLDVDLDVQDGVWTCFCLLLLSHQECPARHSLYTKTCTTSAQRKENCANTYQENLAMKFLVLNENGWMGQRRRENEPRKVDFSLPWAAKLAAHVLLHNSLLHNTTSWSWSMTGHKMRRCRAHLDSTIHIW